MEAATVPVTGNITTNTTWTNGNVYVIQTDVSVTNNATLTVNPGAIVKFETSADSLIITNGSILSAVGSGALPIYFTSYKNDIGGDTDGVPATPASGDWEEIKVDAGATATIKHAKIDYGGAGSGALIWNNGGTITLATTTATSSSNYVLLNQSGTATCTSDCDFAYAWTNVYAYGGNVDIRLSDIRNNNYYGIYANTSGSVSVTDTDFYSNGLFGAVYAFYSNGLTLTHSGNTATGGFLTVNGISAGGNLATSQTWTDDGMPYVVGSAFVVPDTKTLTISPGVVVKFQGVNSAIHATGTLAAYGTANNPIYFTSVLDDNADGHDTTANGASGGTAGDWRWIVIASASSTMDYTVVKYGGSAPSGPNVYQTAGAFRFWHSTSSDSAYYALYTSTPGSLSANGVFASSTVGIGAGASGSVRIESSEITGQSYGLYSFDGTVSIERSEIADNDIGIYLLTGTSDSFESKLVEIHDNSSYGVYSNSSTLSSKNRMDVNHIYNNGGPGIYSAAGRMQIWSSDLHDNTYGLRVATNADDIWLRSNSFEDNDNEGIKNDDSGNNLLATWSYWGSTGGPNGAGGDGVSTGVNYTPYLTAKHYVQLTDVGATSTSVDSGNKIHWDGSYGAYLNAWAHATSTWNALGSVSIEPDTIFVDEDLHLTTSTSSSEAWAGLWAPDDGDFGDEDDLFLNSYYLDTAEFQANNGALQKNVIVHELGHALGLGHSPGEEGENIMWPFTTATTTLGAQDTSDYYFLWP